MCRSFPLTYYNRNRLIILELTNRIRLDEVQTCDRICNWVISTVPCFTNGLIHNIHPLFGILFFLEIVQRPIIWRLILVYYGYI